MSSVENFTQRAKRYDSITHKDLVYENHEYILFNQIWWLIREAQTFLWYLNNNNKTSDAGPI